MAGKGRALRHLAKAQRPWQRRAKLLRRASCTLASRRHRHLQLRPNPRLRTHLSLCRRRIVARLTLRSKGSLRFLYNLTLSSSRSSSTALGLLYRRRARPLQGPCMAGPGAKVDSCVRASSGERAGATLTSVLSWSCDCGRKHISGYRVRPYLSTGVGVRLSVGEPLEAKRPPTRTGVMRRLWGWLGQAWVASSEL